MFTNTNQNVNKYMQQVRKYEVIKLLTRTPSSVLTDDHQNTIWHILFVFVDIFICICICVLYLYLYILPFWCSVIYSFESVKNGSFQNSMKMTRSFCSHRNEQEAPKWPPTVLTADCLFVLFYLPLPVATALPCLTPVIPCLLLTLCALRTP